MAQPEPTTPPTWPCVACGYNVFGTRDARCPECGHDFNPNAYANPTEPDPSLKASRRIAFTLVVAQFTPVAIPVASYIVARLVLGRWPIPMRDDPKDIPGLEPLLILWPLTLCCIAPVLPIIHTPRWTYSYLPSLSVRRHLRQWMFISWGAWVVTLLCLALIKARIIVWMAD